MKDKMVDWDDGPWKTEPDKAQWIDDKTGLDCLIVRNFSGALCGYVGLPTSHKLHGKGYDEVSSINNDICVHGELTFAGKCTPHGDEESKGICHTGDIANKDVWWLGFDCHHCGDTAPRDTKFAKEFGGPFKEIIKYGKYRDFEYVKAETELLASQLIDTTTKYDVDNGRPCG